MQLRCACGNKAASGGSCDECARRRPDAQRALRPGAAVGSGNGGANTAPPSNGHPLDTTTRHYFERRFGHGFGDVRVHDDGRADGAARAVDALAYTSGRDIVFAAGRYEPHSERGVRLLAHELTHVVQQRSGLAPARAGRADDPAEHEAERNAQRLHSREAMRFEQRAPAIARSDGEGTTVTVEGADGPPSCTLDQHRAIEPAANAATERLRIAVERVDAYLSAPDAAANRSVRDALERHFHDTSTPVAELVRERLERIRTDITSRQPFTVECHDATDDACTQNDFDAYVRRSANLLVFCATFFSRVAAASRPGLLIHEMAHALTDLDIDDRSYRQDRVLRFLSTEEALDNAESYNMFAREVESGVAVTGTTQADDIDDCDDRTKGMIEESVGRAERWNRIALVNAASTLPGVIAGSDGLYTLHVGDNTEATRLAARRAFRTIRERMASPIDVRCDARAGPDCGARTVYKSPAVDNFGLGLGLGSAIGGGLGLVGGLVAGLSTGLAGLGIGVGLGLLALGAVIGMIAGAATSHDASIHVCPAWSGLGGVPERTEAMLAAIYETYANLDAATAARHAALARALHERNPGPPPAL
jgi:Domain of unknown function (DUF4157)/Lysine-specific metallo-endopeptidase